MVNADVNVSASSLRIGPKGLGDPDDYSLRRVEKDIKIPQKMRDKARATKCVQEVKAFHECVESAGLKMFFNCRKPNQILKDCIKKWFNDKDFKEECTKEFLAERAEYRRTGIPPEYYHRIKNDGSEK
ncbi:COX assembly mitochondrial protein homolog [Lycorma delicatula]|uniref:COX assembly mitochondrial protein homolog n=1 Tax=Lycorma delicatula TaxID=130591 RepID=UPI003F513EC9